MTYRIKTSTAVRKKLRKLGRSGRFDARVFHEVLRHLEEGEPLPLTYQDHQLQGRFAHLRELHLGFNLLVLYERDDALQLITLVRMGTHPELFGE